MSLHAPSSPDPSSAGRSPANRSRQGVVLIIVAGLAMMLSTMMLAVLLRAKGEAGKSQLLVREAQARVMLNAALLYLQETARLGWGRECYGWTDVRDGSLGPRGPVSTAGALPAPSWWNAAWGAYPPAANFPVGAPTAMLRWPAPGSAMQGDCFAWERPPYAIELTYSYNPFQPRVGAVSSTLDRRALAGALGYSNSGAGASTPVAGAKGNLQPQPIASYWSDFAAGGRDAANRPRIAPGSSGLGWFRIYRETPADCDNDGNPWYDHVAFPTTGHHATFIITCGGGSTYGRRWWNLPGATDRALEPSTAAESGFFVDEDQFDNLMRANRILWYRVAWSGSVGGNWDPGMYLRPHVLHAVTGTNNPSHSPLFPFIDQRINGPNNRLNGENPINQVGTISWIQRLFREPPRW